MAAGAFTNYYTFRSDVSTQTDKLFDTGNTYSSPWESVSGLPCNIALIGCFVPAIGGPQKMQGLLLSLM